MLSRWLNTLRHFSLKRRLRAVFQVALFSGLLSWGIYGINLSLVQRQFKTIRDVSQSLEARTSETASTVTQLINAAELYFWEPSIEHARNMQTLSSKLNEQLSDPLFDSNTEAEKLKKLTGNFVIVTGQVGTRFSSASQTIRAAPKMLGAFQKLHNTTAVLRKIETDISHLLLLFGDHIARREVIPEQDVKSVMHNLNSNVTRTPTNVRTELEDFLINLDGAQRTWNRAISEYHEKYVPQRVALLRASISLGNGNVQSLSNIFSKRVAPIYVWALILLAAIVSSTTILLVGFGWVFDAWRKEMATLTKWTNAALSGTNPTEEMLSDTNKGEELIDSNDEVESARRAIKQTLLDLAILRQHLEEKVQERTKHLREAQAQVVQSAKLSGLGSMAAGVAHELNNPLQVVSLALESIEFQLQKANAPINKVELIRAQIERMTKIIQQLKRLARNDLGATESWSPLTTMVDNSQILVRRDFINAGIETKISVFPLIEVYCDPVRFETVLSNLLGNAADALVSAQIPKPSVYVEALVSPIGELLLTVQDNGPGIPEDIRAKIFDPFFTTKEVGKGTGLGLSLAHQVLTEMNATIDVESVIGKYTRFTIRIPKERVKNTVDFSNQVA